MHSHRPSSRRVPDWQTGCMDSKWRWIVPWGVFGVVGVALGSLGFTPWTCETVERNISYEFKLRIAEHDTSASSGISVIRFGSASEVQRGEVVLSPAPPELQRDDSWDLREQKFEQRLKWKHDIRVQIQRELKKNPASSTIVLRVEPQVEFETIALVWTSIEAVSKATLYLEVSSTDRRGVD